jgi:hypothetical protein
MSSILHREFDLDSPGSQQVPPAHLKAMEVCRSSFMYLLPMFGLPPLNSGSMLAVIAVTDLVACCVAAWHQVVKDASCQHRF